MNIEQMLSEAKEIARAAKLDVVITIADKDEVEACEADFGLKIETDYTGEELYLMQIVSNCQKGCAEEFRNARGMMCHCNACGKSGVKLTKEGGYCKECLESGEACDLTEELINPDPAFYLYTYSYSPGNRYEPPSSDNVDLATSQSFMLVMQKVLEIVVRVRTNNFAMAKADEKAAKAEEEYEAELRKEGITRGRY